MSNKKITKKFEATYIIQIKGTGDQDGGQMVTAQMLRDQLVQALEKMWLLHHIFGFSLEEVRPEETKSKFEKFERIGDNRK